MPGILTPELALRHLAQLSTDVRASVVLSGDGDLLAGDAAAAGPARELVGVLSGAVGAAGGELLAPLQRAGRDEGSALVVRAPDSLAVVVAAGPHALLPLLRHDLVELLRAMGEAIAQVPLDASAMPSTAAGSVAIWDASRRVQMLEATDFAVGTAISAGLSLLDAGRP